MDSVKLLTLICTIHFRLTMAKSESTKYRNRLKQSDPEKYKEMQELNRLKAKERRDRLKNEATKRRPDPKAVDKVKRQREQAAVRQQRRREKLKLMNPVQPKKSPQCNSDTIRERNKMYKRKQRENQSSQKKAWIRKKDREQHRATYHAHKNVLTPSEGFSAKKSEYNAVSKARQALPQQAQQYASVLEKLTYKCTPRKRKAISDQKAKKRRCLFSELDCLSQESKSVRRKIAARIVRQKKCSRRKICNILRLGRNMKLVRKKTRTTTKFSKLQVQEFYKREDISRTMPQKRYATKQGPGYLLQHSIQAAHIKYKKMYPTEMISYATFARLRPRNVRLLSPKYREYCVCVYCVNVRYKVMTLCKFQTMNKLKHEEDLYDAMLCEKSSNMRFNNMECVEGKCKRCEDRAGQLHKLYNFDSNTKAEIVVWCTWRRVMGPRGMRRELQARSGTIGELLDELLSDLQEPVKGVSFFQHLFTAKWQQREFLNIKQHLPDNWILQVMDFAKNRQTKYNDEIKAAFYSPDQITIHPVVTYYNSDAGIVRHATIVFSSDNIHDYHAVDHYTSMVNKKVIPCIDNNIDTHCVWSDGCSAQYKSAGPFADYSLKGYNLRRNFFGSEHGKSDGDGETGIINRCLDRAITGESIIIKNAEDAYDYCAANFTLNDTLSKRDFILVKQGEINRDRSHTHVRTTKGTRKIHQMYNNPGTPYMLHTRKLSCFCKACTDQSNHANRCANPDVGIFRKQKLIPISTEPDSTIPEELTAAHVEQALLGYLEDSPKQE